ncbi:hypothetical protein QOZ80_1AG0016140 [Eleusine coracana subsp. coracana]|nr:hypothetical protein QOZ80_1AG0016140 [Eleusine coracana subsp. coracana]
MVQTLPLPFSQAILTSFLIFLVTPLIQADEDDQLYFTLISLVVFWCISNTYVDLGSRSDFSGFTTSSINIKIYTETADFVVISYVSLLLVNWSNIWLAIFPVIAVGFILALYYELNHQRRCDDGKGRDVSGPACAPTSSTNFADDPPKPLKFVPDVHSPAVLGRDIAGSSGDESWEAVMLQEAAALVPYWVLCVLTGAAPGVAPASVLLWKSSLAVLFVTVHTVAAELLGENVMLFILPEVAPVLLWFSLHLDRHAGLLITADKIKFDKNVITVLGAASVAFVAVSMDDRVLSYCTKAMVSCGVSGLLVYYFVFMLHQWPGIDSTTTAFVEAVKLLKLWANILLIAAALLVFAFVAAVGMSDKNIFQRLCDTFLEFIV